MVISFISKGKSENSFHYQKTLLWIRLDCFITWRHHFALLLGFGEIKMIGWTFWKLFYKSLFAHQFLQLEGFFLVIFTWNLPGSCDQPVQEQVDEAGGGHCGPILGPRLAIYVICCQTAPAIYKVTINQTYFWIYLKPFICHIFYITF